MNYRMVARIVGSILVVEAALMAPLAFLAALWGEQLALQAFIRTIFLLLILGFSPRFFLKPTNHIIYAREGFVIVGLSWTLMSIFGAIPLHRSGACPTFISALFEAVSGFTTTGATMLSAVESMPRTMLLWRSLTHWIGGMGVLVFVTAIVPLSGGRAMHLLRAEVPGPTADKLVPKTRTSSLVLYGIYIALTIMMIVLLLLGDMPLFDSVNIAFATAGTGGFAITNNSIAAYDSAYLQWVIAIFMAVFSVSFNLYFLVLIGSWRSFFKSEELRWFLCIALFATLTIAWNIAPLYNGATAEKILRDSFFQVSTIMSTTGFASTDFSVWPEYSRVILVLLMIIGACAGSTGGGLKVSRLVVIVKSIFCEIRSMVSPRTINIVRLEGKRLENSAVHSIFVYALTALLLTLGSLILISFDGHDFTSNLTAVLACFNNIGPGLDMVGPTSNFGCYSSFSALVLCLDMLLGRLEIFPLIIMLSPSTWRRRRTPPTTT